MTQSKTFLEKLENIDRRVIYWTLVILCAIPFVRPLGLPVPLASTTKIAFEIVDNLNEGDAVIFKVPSVGIWPELGPSHIAVFKHLIQKGAKVIMFGLATDAPTLITNTIEGSRTWINDYGAEYGIDYVNMGFIAGGETAIASIAADAPGTFKADMQGTPVNQLPIMEGISGASDFALILNFEGMDHYIYFARHWTSPYEVKQVICPTGTAAADISPYYEAGIVAGVNVGIAGGAGWELLLKAPGEALIGLDAISISHVVFLVFVIAGNVIYYLRSRKEGIR